MEGQGDPTLACHSNEEQQRKQANKHFAHSSSLSSLS
jgi:hypothetical protein